jgi:predicted XRE-type DNA-binding protein
MCHGRFIDVWCAIEDTPEQVVNMRLRAILMTALKDRIAQSGISEVQAAELLGVTELRVSELVGGKINLFDLDALVNMATAASLRIELRIT